MHGNCITYGFNDTQLVPDGNGIYCIENKTNGKKYIGRASRTEKGRIVGFRERWKEHTYCLSTNRHPCRALQNSFNKHGKEAFVFYIIEDCNENQSEREAYYIQTLGSMTNKHGYNQISCDYGPRELSEDTRRRMSISQKNRPPMKEETRKKIIVALTGRVQKPETRAKLSALKKGIPKNPEHVMASAKARVAQPFDFIHVVTGERFTGYNISAFARERGLSQGNLSEVFRGKRPSHKGWVRANPHSLN